MDIPIFSKFFSKNEDPLVVLDSIVIKNIKSFCEKNGYYIFQNKPIFHLSNSINIELMMFIPYTGIVLFEYKEWSYKDLKNAKPQKTAFAPKSDNSLAFNKIDNFIREKLSDVINIEDIDIYHFVLMEQLTLSEYEDLDDDIKAILPSDRIIFNDDNIVKISKKIKSLKKFNSKIIEEHILSYLFSQYMFIDNKQTLFANKEQRDFIDREIEGFENLKAPRLSGKTSSLLQKAIFLKLKNRNKKVAIVVLNDYYATILKQNFLDIIEKSHVVFDLSDISIFTPLEVINQHRKKLKIIPIKEVVIEPILLEKEFDLADYVLVDDTNLHLRDFIFYIKNLQKDKNIVYVNFDDLKPTATFKTTYTKDILTIKGNVFALILKLINKNKDKNIIIYTSKMDIKEIEDDIKGFCNKKTVLLDSKAGLSDNSSENIKICDYEDISTYQCDIAIITDTDKTDIKTLNKAIYSSKETTYVIYETQNENIKKIKEIINED
jgi:hypothetical protein